MRLNQGGVIAECVNQARLFINHGHGLAILPDIIP